MFSKSLQQIDPEVFDLIKKEHYREEHGLELIPSENYVSKGVLEAMGSIFTNKYSEGYPGKRYYGGQTYTDLLETLTIERAKKLFRADHANVQALSGAPANTAAYFSWLEPGDTVIGMDLTHGGHLTHGHPVTHLAGIFNFVRYKMKDVETGEIDYDQMHDTAKKNNAKIILAGFTCYPREMDYAKMKEIADDVGAIAMCDIAHISGLIAANVLANPLDYGFQIVTTTTHKTLRGPRAGMILSKGTAGNPLKKPEKTVENIPTLIDRSIFPGLQGGPHMHTIAGIGVALKEAGTPEFKSYAEQVLKNAKALADELMKHGAKLVTNGTDNHLMVVNCLKSWGINGKEVEGILDSVGITLNKNTIPDDPEPPYRPSGIRLGTPAMTSRGLGEEESRQVARWMHEAIQKRNDDTALARIKSELEDLTKRFPVYSNE